MSHLHLPIDHVGLLAPTIAELVAEFRLLGFTIVGPAELTAVNADGELEGLGQFSAHVMFRDDYIELTAVEAPTPAHHLAHFLHAPWGLRLLLISCEDISDAHAYCERSELSPTPIQEASRLLPYRQDAAARFSWFGLPSTDWDDALIAFVQHHSRAEVFDPSISQHDNGAEGLRTLYYASEQLPATYRELADGGRHEIRLVPPGSETTILGYPVSDTTPFAGLGIQVHKLEQTRKYFSTRDVDYRDLAGAVSVQLTSGVCLIFSEDAASE